MVTIDSGPITAEHKFSEVPKEKWNLLMGAKRDFISVNLNYDCRNLVMFMNEAKEVYKDLGFDSVDHMVAEGYELQPDDVYAAVEWLRRNQPEAAVGLVNIKEAQHHAWKARHEAGESFRSIARDEGVDDKTVANRVRNRPSYNTKTSAPKRKVIGYRITEYTQPQTAAEKIRATFGDEFADELGKLLR